MLNAPVHTPPRSERDRILHRISLSLNLIVLALTITLCFVARMVCITVIVASFLAILLDPVVVRLQKMYIRLSLAAAMVVVCGMILMGIAAYGAYEKANDFAAQLPIYSLRLREAAKPIITKFERLQQNAESIAPAPGDGDGIPEIKVHEVMNWPSVLVRGVGSITSGLIMTGMIPFLCFFLLIKKRELSTRFRIVFERRINAPKFVRDLEEVIRGFVVGNLVVGSIMAGTTAFVLFLLGIKNPIMLGIVLTVLNLVPFLGAIAAAVIAVAAALTQFATLWPFIVLLFTLITLHVISQNVLIPRIIGSRVNVGPVAVIIGMLFWGWLWGVPGLLLAVPLTALVKLIAETKPSLEHFSCLLAASPRQQTPWVRLKDSIRPVEDAYRNPAPEPAGKP